jgi:hypothetical protein
MITMRSASSHQKSRLTSPIPSVVAPLATNATEIARVMSSIIPGWRLLSSDQAPVRKGQPP